MRRTVAGIDLDPPRLVLVAYAVATGIAVVVAASTSATAFGVYNPAWDGASDLSREARAAGTTVTVLEAVAGYGTAPPNRTVAVLLAPDEPYTASEAARVRAFVRRGGTLLVADDFGAATNPLLADLGVNARLDGATLRDERSFYRAPPLVVAGNVTAHPLTAGIDELTLNYGTAVLPGNASVLVRTSGFAYRDADGDGALDADETLASYPVATVEPVGDGEVIVVGDPSAFINAMLDRPGNRAFIRGLFARHDHVLLDYSHAAGLPPLRRAVLRLRGAPGLQFGLVALGLAAIALWRRGLTAPLVRAGRRLAARSTRRRDGPGMDAAAVRAYLRRRHPGWDEERLDRVTTAIITQRRESSQDE